MRNPGRPPIDPLGRATKSVYLRLPGDVYDALDQRSRMTGVSVPELLRRKIRRVEQRDLRQDERDDDE